MSAFETAAERGDAVGAFQRAFVNGALWATALSWSNAIREVTRAFLPDETEEIVLGEVLAASITTLLAIAAAMVVLFCCARDARKGHAGTHRAGTRVGTRVGTALGVVRRKESQGSDEREAPQGSRRAWNGLRDPRGPRGLRGGGASER